MKAKILVVVIAAIFYLSLTVQAQENYILNGDFEEQGVWEIAVSEGEMSDVSWEFGTLAQAPLAGDEGCLRVTYTDKDASLNQILYQRVMLTVGDTYYFEGAFKDAGTGTDVEKCWHQIIIWPTIADDDPSDNITGGPHWRDGDASILLNHSARLEHFGIGLNTTFEDDQIFEYGNKVGLGDGEGQGDTTVYTVPPALFRFTDTLELGAIGDEIEYFVALQFGQYVEAGSGIVNTVDFTFDEFKLMGPEKGTSALMPKELSSSMEVYPNPVQNLLNVKHSKGISSVSILNVLGQEVMSIRNIQKQYSTIDISELSTGLYILSVTDEAGRKHSSKILKK